MFSNYNVLFPVDFSDLSKAAAPHAADQARRLGAKLHFLHSVEEGLDLDRVLQEQTHQLAEFVAQAATSQGCALAVTYGEPAAAIVNYAKHHDINAVIMPTRGYGALRRLILGSVTLEVLRRAPVPVWTITGDSKAHALQGPVLCAIDLEPGSEEVLLYASALAEQLHAKLVVLHAVPSSNAIAFWHPSHLPAALSENVARQKLQALLQQVNVPAESIIDTGEVVDIVRGSVRRIGARLIVVGRGATGSLGTNTFNLIRHASCAVVSCPPRTEAAVSFWNEWQQAEEVEQKRSGFRLVGAVNG